LEETNILITKDMTFCKQLSAARLKYGTAKNSTGRFLQVDRQCAHIPSNAKAPSSRRVDEKHFVRIVVMQKYSSPILISLQIQVIDLYSIEKQEG
jgi:hypothetical protein